MNQSFPGRVLHTLNRFLHIEAASSIVLLIAALAALVWANTPAAASYEALWHTPLHFWVNEGLMTVFFLVVGMEIRREMREGVLASREAAVLPLAAAACGVLVPAALYLSLSPEAPARSGWAVPTATDIAFAVGVLALLGKSMPRAARVFLLAIAIVDDIVAIALIAILYSGGLSLSGVALIAAGVALVLVLQRRGVNSVLAYIPAGVILWLGLREAGVHPTLAGVILGFMTPAASPAVAARVETFLHPWVAFAIMPIFAFANAGVRIDGTILGDAAAMGIAVSTGVALLIGKPIGILLGSWLAVRSGWCRLPKGLGWTGVIVVGCLGGIGFTMSIFIATLAFADATLLNAAKAGVLIGSFAAGIAGLALGLAARKRR